MYWTNIYCLKIHLLFVSPWEQLKVIWKQALAKAFDFLISLDSVKIAQQPALLLSCDVLCPWKMMMIICRTSRTEQWKLPSASGALSSSWKLNTLPIGNPKRATEIEQCLNAECGATQKILHHQTMFYTKNFCSRRTHLFVPAGQN